MTRISFFVSFLIGLGFLIFGKSILILLLGNDYQEIIFTITISLVGINIINCSLGIPNVILTLLNQAKEVSISYISINLMGYLLGFIFLKNFGFVEFAFVFYLTYFISKVISVLVLNKKNLINSSIFWLSY